MVASDGDVTAEKADILPPRLAAWGMPHRGALVKAWCRQYNLAPACLCTESLAQCSALEAEIRYETRTARWPESGTCTGTFIAAGPGRPGSEVSTVSLPMMSVIE